MTKVRELLKQGKRGEIWSKYCGFLDLDIGEYMDIQRGLLEEQLPKLSACELGRVIMKGRAPKTPEEFRRAVPFTTYKDYVPYLSAQNEEALPEKPVVWAHTSGRGGERELKWIPYTRRTYELIGELAFSCFILAAARFKGDVALPKGMKIPFFVAPAPYVTGITIQCMQDLIGFTVIPPVEKAVKMQFAERIREALLGSLSEGMDFFFGLPSVLLKIGERFSGAGGGARPKMKLPPKAIFRMAKAAIKSRLMGRPILPKDIWKVKGIVCGGADTSIFSKKVAETWGVRPLEGYMSTEHIVGGVQSWARGGFVLYPQLIFWEFITEKDYHAFMRDPSYIPKSLLMDEVRPDTEYVVAGTSFHGGALVRYIIGDLIKVVSLEDREAGIRLPHFSFMTRVDGLLDVGGFTRLTEKILWQAIESAGIPYEEWTLRKESRDEKPILHLYMELKDGVETESSIAEKVHSCLKQLDPHYREMEELAGLKPLAVTIVSKGTFQRYFEERQAAGADLGHLKPPHVNASDTMIENLLRMSAWKI